MKLYSIIFLFLALTVAGPQSSGSVRLQLSTGANQPLQTTGVRVWFETSNRAGYPLEAHLTSDSSGVVLIENLPPSKVRIHLETTGFDDYSADVTVKAGNVTTVAARLEPVEELRFERLSDVQAQKFIQACKQMPFWKIESTRFSFDDPEKWTALWSELKLAAPRVDFNKWRVLAWITRASDSGAESKIRRITYNPTRKIIRVRRDFAAPNLDVRLPVISCTAEFVLIPPRAGEVMFR